MSKILVVICISFLFILSAFADEYKIIHTKGSVSVKRNNQTFNIDKKFDLKNNDTVFTAANSLAIIKSKKLTLKIVENSEVSINELGKEIQVDIEEGGVVANYVKQAVKDIVGTKLVVKTKHSAMGVRGTTFFAYNHKDQTSYLTVKEGEVEFKGKKSNSVELVNNNRTSFTNNDLENIKPKKVGFEEFINWELRDLKVDLTQPKRLFSKMEEQWNNYKKENEKKWKDNKQNMEDQWNKMKDQL